MRRGQAELQVGAKIYGRPLRRTILVGSAVFITALCVVLCVATAIVNRHELYQRYKACITDLLVYVETCIDVDDLKQCLETGEKSEHFHDVQALIDRVKDTHKIDFLYMIVPLNDSDHDNIQNVMAAMSAFERQYEPEEEVVLGELTGDSYTPDVARKYLDAAGNTSEITFFDDWTEWGNDFTGVLPLIDSEGNLFAELCVDVPVSEIGNAIFRATATDALIIVIIGFVAVILLMGWVSRDVVEPINRLERSVLDFAGRSHGQRDIELLRIEVPDIHTGNEVEALSDAVVRMTEDMRSYVKDILHVEREAERMKAQASAMKVLANKDPLTGVRNKTAYDAEVAVIEERIAIGDVDFGIVMIDLNHLKVLNDTYGHEKGNVTIKLLCQIICDTFAHSPVFRIGGDEFCVVIRGYDLAHVFDLLEDFERRLEQSGMGFGEDGLPAKPWEHVSASYGLAVFDPQVDQGYASVFERANAAMYEDKRRRHAGRGDLA